MAEYASSKDQMGSQPQESEREAVRSSILKFLDSPTHLLHKTLDETLAEILSPQQPQSPPRTLPRGSASPEQLAVRQSLRAFLDSPTSDPAMSIEETARRLAFPEQYLANAQKRMSNEALYEHGMCLTSTVASLATQLICVPSSLHPESHCLA